MIKIVTQQYEETLNDEDINNMDWITKVQYLKRNPITVTRQTDHIFNHVVPNILYSGMHRTGQVSNDDNQSETVSA